MLGLNDTVTHEQFEAVREGLHPKTGEFLRLRLSADRISTDGEVESKARSLYDFTFRLQSLSQSKLSSVAMTAAGSTSSRRERGVARSGALRADEGTLLWCEP